MTANKCFEELNYEEMVSIDGGNAYGVAQCVFGTVVCVFAPAVGVAVGVGASVATPAVGICAGITAGTGMMAGGLQIFNSGMVNLYK